MKGRLCVHWVVGISIFLAHMELPLNSISPLYKPHWNWDHYNFHKDFHGF